MKRLFLLLLFIPTLLHGLSKEEKELARLAKGMTQEKAQKILQETNAYPSSSPDWWLYYRDKELIMFKAPGNSNTSLELDASIILRRNKIHVVFYLSNGMHGKINLEIFNKKLIMAKFNTVTGIKNNGAPIRFIYLKDFKMAKLNDALITDLPQGQAIKLGKILASQKLIHIKGLSGSGIWRINNPQVIYAAALVLKPDLTFDEFLAAF